jgi:LacI family purine nucleotide synthesis repressor
MKKSMRKATGASPRPITIQDVADEMGMHKSTISLALSGRGNIAERTRVRVMTKAREMGYSPNPLAQRLAFGSNNNVVYIFSGVLDVGLATEKVLLLQRHLNRLKLETPIYTCGETNANEELRQLCLQRPRAIVCAAQMIDKTLLGELETYQKNGGIVITYDIALPFNCDQVVFDREDNAYQAARYLLEHGHRQLGLSISHPADWEQKTNVPQDLRIAGFKRALAEFKMPFQPEWLFENPTYETGGAALAQKFLALKKRPSALCIVNDYVALAFMTQIMRAGVRVPDEVSIIGHDDQPVAEYCPVPLTCISQPVQKTIDAVVELLKERLEGSTAAPRTITIKGQLVQRQSVKAR